MDHQTAKRLLDAYSQASSQWDAYRTTGNRPLLEGAAHLICDAISGLAADSAYWADVINAAMQVDQNRQAVVEVLADLDGFAEQEWALLREALGDAAAAVRLTSDLVNAIQLVNSSPSGQSIVNLQRAVRAFRDEVCAAQKQLQAKDMLDGMGGPRIRHLARLTLRGVHVLGGLSVIAVDVGAAGTMPVALGSVVGGADMVLGAVRQ